MELLRLLLFAISHSLICSYRKHSICRVFVIASGRLLKAMPRWERVSRKDLTGLHRS